MAISEKLIDKRVVARNIKKGVISNDEYQRLLCELPDREDNIYKPEEAEEQEDFQQRPDDVSTEIKTTEVSTTQIISPEPYSSPIEPPAIEPPAISFEQKPASEQEVQQEPDGPASSTDTSQNDSNQPESQSDPYKSPFGQE